MTKLKWDNYEYFDHINKTVDTIKSLKFLLKDANIRAEAAENRTTNAHNRKADVDVIKKFDESEARYWKIAEQYEIMIDILNEYMEVTVREFNNKPEEHE